MLTLNEKIGHIFYKYGIKNNEKKNTEIEYILGVFKVWENPSNKLKNNHLTGYN